MEIYVDIVIIENFIINMFLLMLTFKVLRFQYNNRGIYLASLIGSLYTLVIFSDFKILSSLVFKIIIAMIMIVISVRNRKITNLVKGTITFFLNSFILCGLTFSVVMFQNSYNLLEEFSIQKYSIKGLLISVMLLYIVVIRIVDLLKERALIKNFTYDIYISVAGEILILKGFLDTGNELREVVSNLPCIIIEEKYLEKINIREEEKYFINYNTITERGKIEGFKGDKVMIKNTLKDEWTSIEAIICKSPMMFSKENEYQALLSRGVI